MVANMTTDAVVYLVDDDPAVLKSLHWLVESASLAAKPLNSAASFLEAYDPRRPGCLILDVRMPQMTGLQLQSLLKERNIELPIIIMTGHSDVPTCTESFRNGAFDFIEKPADDEFLIARVQQAIATDIERRQQEVHRTEISKRLATLTPREREVMDAIVSGKSQKRIASELGISFQTAAKHRAKVLTKLQVGNDVEVVRALLVNETNSAT
jgi:RNA polymerase sigma factor (sigma-70 family)